MITKSMILTSGQNQFLYFWPKPTFFYHDKAPVARICGHIFFTWVPTCGYVPVTVKNTGLARNYKKVRQKGFFEKYKYLVPQENFD